MLGRAARLTEGPLEPPRALGTLSPGVPETGGARYNTEKRSESVRYANAERIETITLNGGSLGSWVDEERS